MRKPWPALCLVALLTGCPDDPAAPGVPKQEDGTAPATSTVAAALEEEPEPVGPAFTLAEGRAPDAGWTAVPQAEVEPLDDAATRALLDRLQPLQEEPGKSFARRQGPPPPPLTGDTVKQPFPPRPGPPPVEPAPAGPLEVLRFMPEGDVPLAPHLSVTFSQPMVPVASLEALAAEAVPVRLTPQPAGRWRWVSATTLLFEPDPRFPMATEYQVEVPAGTRAASGAALAQPARWSFRTPAPTVVRCWPQGGPTTREPTFVLTFDQAIDPAAVLTTLQVSAPGHAAKLRLATDEETRVLAPMLEPGRSVVFRAAERLPGDATVTVQVGPGTPSTEGPRRTEQAATFTLQTYGALRVVSHRAGWGDECPPGTPFMIELSNPLDAKAFSSKLVTLDPPVPGLQVRNYGSTIQLQGATRANTTYRATLSAALTDAFGQTLGEAVTLEFRTTAPRPAFHVLGDGMQVLDPAGAPRVTARSIALDALRVTVHAVDPATDWQAFQAWRGQMWRDAPPPMPGRKTYAGEVKVTGGAEAWVETPIDVSSALTGGLGHAVVLIEPTSWPERGRRPRVGLWVQSTRLGLDAQRDAADLLAWVTRLEDGAPVQGAQVRLLPGGPAAATDAGGVAQLRLANRARLLLATHAGDSTFFEGGFDPYTVTEQLRWFTFDDRHLYRPGEDVRVKGWVRRLDPGEGGDVLPLGQARGSGYVVHDARGQELKKGAVQFDELGGFDLVFELPDTIHVGPVTVQFDLGHVHQVRVAEFRRPEFEVSVAPGASGPYLAGEQAVVTATASYFAGGALPGAAVTWRVEGRPGNFTPPNRRDFVFGENVPWWLQARGGDLEAPLGRGGRGRGGWGGGVSPPQHQATIAGVTDAQGKHHLQVQLNRLRRPLAITAEAMVQDVNRQAWTGATSLLVHPAACYVGLRAKRPYFPQGEPLALDVLVVNLEGEALEGHEVQVELTRLEWEWVDGEGLREKVASSEVRKVTPGAQPAAIELKQPAGGTWRLTATTRDAQGRRALTSTQVWVAGGKAPASKEVEEERVTLVPDKEDYRAGDTAEVLLVAPFAPAEALLTWRRSGIVRHERFRLEESTRVVTVPIDDAMVPDLTVHVALVGSAPREGATAGKRRPAYASGQVTLKIPPRRRALDVTATPARRELEPGATTSVDLVVRDHAGQPVAGAEVCVAVVDEAVLALAGHAAADPLALFYAPRGPGAHDQRGRQHLRLQAEALPPEAVEKSAGLDLEADGALQPSAPPGGARAARGRDEGAGGGAAAPPPIALRKDLSALAHWSPRVKTDARGQGRVELKLPDSLTRWRVIAVAAAGANSFGARESTLTARLPLMVRPSAPRFLNFGDTFELAMVVQNQTDAPLAVEVAVRASNLTLTQGQGRRLTVPAHDRREVRFPAAALKAGRARVQVAAAATTNNAWADAQELTLPVWTPATSEAFATYGTLDGEGDAALAQPIAAPMDAWPDFGGLDVTTSSTNLQALTDAVIYLVDYPYGCAEQVASRMLALVAIRDVLEAFQVPGLPSAERLNEAVTSDLQRLRELQSPGDGGWGFWRADEPSWPYLSLHVLHALARTKAKGYPVDAGLLKRAHDYAKTIERRIPSTYSAESRRALEAYALFARYQLGDVDAGGARRLLGAAGGVAKVGADGGLSFEAAGWLYALLRRGDAAAQADAAALRRHLANRVTETSNAAHFVTSYSDGAHVLLHSDRRVDGVLLEALLDDPAEVQGDLAPKLVQGLLGHRRQGRWQNTQENAFILLALDAYFRKAERLTPDFVARAWLGDAFAGEHAFRGRTTERAQVTVPMETLQEVAQAASDAPPLLTLSKEGAGRMYYRIGLRYAPRDLKLAPLDAGFSVQRRYEAVDDPKDVRRDADGTWRVKAGARVRVHVTMVAPGRRYHVALTDPLPAGLEPLDPALRSTGALPTDASSGRGGRGWWWSRTWYEHSGLRDERAEAFTSLLWEGVHTFTYTARATTPGVFVAPPAKAEEMYAPETFGRSGTDRVVVE
jgi:uncharacterized protein YfaS (alpha-2-macroglobulin family)